MAWGLGAYCLISKYGKIAVMPYVEDDWWRHSVQWQMYSARGAARGVTKRICPHWQRASIEKPLGSDSMG
jgi:hypothetical protein